MFKIKRDINQQDFEIVEIVSNLNNFHSLEVVDRVSVAGGGPRVVVWKKQKMFLLHPREKVSIVGSLHDREVACSASDGQG